jgi:hypothetical protein
MRTIKVEEYLRLLGSGALKDLFGFPDFFDPMMLPIRRALVCAEASQPQPAARLRTSDNGSNQYTAYFAGG